MSNDEPSISGDGSLVGFRAIEADFATTNVFVWDAATGDSVLVSRNAAGTGPGNGTGVAPDVSGDGDFVASTRRRPTSCEATSARGDVFVRDLTP